MLYSLTFDQAPCGGLIPIVSLNIYSDTEKDMKRMHNLFNSRDMAFIGLYKLK